MFTWCDLHDTKQKQSKEKETTTVAHLSTEKKKRNDRIWVCVLYVSVWMLATIWRATISNRIWPIVASIFGLEKLISTLVAYVILSSCFGSYAGSLTPYLSILFYSFFPLSLVHNLLFCAEYLQYSKLTCSIFSVTLSFVSWSVFVSFLTTCGQSNIPSNCSWVSMEKNKRIDANFSWMKIVFVF